MDATKWKVLSGAIVVASSYIAARLVQGAWKTIKKEDPPSHPRLPNAHLGTAVIVAGITGIVSTIIKFGTARFIGQKWQDAGGELPEQH